MKKHAILAAGCFWCIEAIYKTIDGVISVQSGYCGGHTSNPTYSEVCKGNTGHAEVCKIVYDEEIITFKELLEVFWKIHDPTTINRQGNDIGTMYRSAIFHLDKVQKKQAKESLKALEESNYYEDKIVTEISPAKPFYPAEDYHNDYFKMNGQEPYCKLVIVPKIAKFKTEFYNKLKKAED